MVPSIYIVHELIHCPAPSLSLSSDDKDWTLGLVHAGQALYHWATALTLNMILDVSPWIILHSSKFCHQCGRYTWLDFLNIDEIWAVFQIMPSFPALSKEITVEGAFLSGPGMLKWRSSVTRLLLGTLVLLVILVIFVRKNVKGKHRAQCMGDQGSLFQSRVSSFLGVDGGQRDHCPALQSWQVSYCF